MKYICTKVLFRNKISLSTDDLAIPPFKDHYNNAEDKAQALKEIEYEAFAGCE